MTPAVPPGLLASLAAAPRGGPFALLLRHADRANFAPGEPGDDVGLTAVGEARAEALSRHESLRDRARLWCESSPVPRCLSTASRLGVSATPNSLLGAPGAFVTDPARAGEAFLRLGAEAIVRTHLAGHPWPFLRSVEDGARRLLASVAGMLAARGGIGLLVSHDTIVMPVIARITGERFEDTWLDPLDGIVIAGEGESRLRAIWRGRNFNVPA